jgi:DNA-binding IscR family transcriptional regulator
MFISRRSQVALDVLQYVCSLRDRQTSDQIATRFHESPYLIKDILGELSKHALVCSDSRGYWGNPDADQLTVAEFLEMFDAGVILGGMTPPTAASHRLLQSLDEAFVMTPLSVLFRT